jgi:hypothetical protein
MPNPSQACLSHMNLSNKMLDLTVAHAANSTLAWNLSLPRANCQEAMWYMVNSNSSAPKRQTFSFLVGLWEEFKQLMPIAFVSPLGLGHSRCGDTAGCVGTQTTLIVFATGTWVGRRGSK